MIERATVTEWLDQEGLESHSAEIEDEKREFRWALVFKAQVFHTTVGQRDVEWDHLMMQTSVGVAENHQNALRELDPDTRQRFVFDLRIALLQQPVGHQLVFHPEEPEILRELVLGLNLHEDPIQKAGFFRRSHQLQTAALLGVTMIRKMAHIGGWN